jgi:hypothetical protein
MYVEGVYMEHYRVLKELSERTKDGHITAGQAASLAMRHGAMLIGTAQSKEGYTPSILLSSHFRNEEGAPEWGIMQPTHRGGARPAIRASSVVETALWAAYGGDSNHPLQRLCIDRSFLPNPERYDLGTYGWKYNADQDSYALRAHQDLMRHTRDMDDETVIGGMDLIVPNEADIRDFTQEPGHVVIFSQQEVIGTLAVRMGDVRQLGSVESYYYDPLENVQ